ncbi:MAG: SpoIIE family protein phosphatase [Thermoanaerobaculales bacterium]|nr:SpoIIE family protein phosphatase [Thermoanaerobaculales bacterium]
MRVLVVEDDASLLSAISTVVESAGFVVTGAGDGVEALECFRRDPFPVVLTDWAMPRMDGLELLREIRKQDPERYCYVILLTGRGDLTWEKGMEAGADDFLTKPYRREELLARLKVARRIMNLQLETARANESLLCTNAELKLFRERMDYELRSAVRVQRALLPSRDIQLPGVTLAWDLGTCTELAGDVCHAFEIDDQYLCFYVLDVSGHGVSAALLSAQVSRLLTPEMSWSRSGESSGERLQPIHPSQVIAELNGVFQNEPTLSQYFTLIYAVFDRERNTLRFSCAGHPGPAVLRAGRPVDQLELAGRPIGMLEGGWWDDIEVSLGPGDSFVLFSDGLTEAMNERGEIVGQARFTQNIEKGRRLDPSALCQTLMEEHRHWCGAEGLQDDCTVMVVKID